MRRGGVEGPALAAIVYAKNDAERLDGVLAGLAGRLRADGVRLAGAVPHGCTGRPAGRRCQMLLEVLSTGRLVDITEDRGPEARGCRLSADALEQVVAASLAALDQGAELLIVNKFGRHEAEGRGFRQAIAAALECEVPVLVAVNDFHEADWRAFSGDGDERLPLEPAAVLDWCRMRLPIGA
jgi:nucleoside-triphosphatase THEP1